MSPPDDGRVTGAVTDVPRGHSIRAASLPTTRTSRATPMRQHPARRSIKATVTTSQRSHGEPGSAAGACAQETRCVLCHRGPPNGCRTDHDHHCHGEGSGQSGLHGEYRSRELDPPGRCDSGDGPQCQDHHHERRPEQEQRPVPVEAAVSLLCCEVMGPDDEWQRDAADEGGADERTHEMPADRGPSSRSQESHERRDSEKGPRDHQQAGDAGHRLEHREREVGHVMGTGAVREGLVELFRELGEAGARDHERGPGGENHQRAGPDAIGCGYGVTNQSRLPSPLLEPAGDEAEAHVAGKTCAVLLVKERGQLVPIPGAPGPRIPAEPGVVSPLIRAPASVPSVPALPPALRQPQARCPDALEPGLSHLDEVSHLRHGITEGLGAGGGDLVRASTVIGFERLNEPALFQPRDRPVERAGTKLHAGESLDVLEEGVSMFGAAGKAHEDQSRRVIRPTSGGGVSRVDEQLHVWFAWGHSTT